MCLPVNYDIVAPDGSFVRVLLAATGGSMAHFELPPGSTSCAVQHRTVDEIWFFLSGEGEFWREKNGTEEIVTVHADVCITIPVGTQFQFRTIGSKSLVAVAITMPLWPGDGEAISIKGIWTPYFPYKSTSPKESFNIIYIFAATITLLLVRLH